MSGIINEESLNEDVTNVMKALKTSRKPLENVIVLETALRGLQLMTFAQTLKKAKVKL